MNKIINEHTALYQKRSEGWTFSAESRCFEGQRKLPANYIRLF